ncbi:hypothetical protein [Tenacibaculum maritimum]|uniref:hypothetical protein n=1 Tax=Tenacibaculum maritimum TaxID=107401 RepID=UPI0038771B6E
MKKKTHLPTKAGKVATKEKVKKTITTSGGFLSDNKKNLLYVGGAIILGYTGYRIYKNVSEGLLTATQDLHESIPIDLSIDTQKATLSSEEAAKAAQQLLDAFNEASPFYGTDEETIKQVFIKLKSAEDFKLVYKSFGKKNYNGNGSPPVGIWRHLDNYSPRDLVYWLKSELSPDDGDVYQIVKERVESANWQF